MIIGRRKFREIQTAVTSYTGNTCVWLIVITSLDMGCAPKTGSTGSNRIQAAGNTRTPNAAILQPASSTESDARLIAIEQLIQSGHIDRAIDELKAIVAAEPRNAGAILRWGELQAFEYNYGFAIQLYNRALELEPQNAKALNARGLAEMAHNQLLNAKKDFQLACARDANNARYRLNLGTVAFKIGNLEMAARCFDEAVRLDRTDCEAFNNRAFLREQQGDFDHALSDYNRACALNPSYYDAFVNRGHLLSMLKRWKDADEDLQRAIAMEPDQATAFFESAISLKARGGPIDGAIRRCGEALDRCPNDPRYRIEILTFRAALLRMVGRRIEAEEDDANARELRLQQSNPAPV